MNHDDLVTRALNWLANSRGCYFVFAEKVYREESPDAIGWIGRWSVLIECKISKSDFYRDRRKLIRALGFGMGQERYYLTPPGLLKPEMIPDGWGLMEAGKFRMRHVVRIPRGGPGTKPDPARSINEVGMLVNHWGRTPDAGRQVTNVPPKGM